jgi:hypothetical protein
MVFASRIGDLPPHLVRYPHLAGGRKLRLVIERYRGHIDIVGPLLGSIGERRPTRCAEAAYDTRGRDETARDTLEKREISPIEGQPSYGWGATGLAAGAAVTEGRPGRRTGQPIPNRAAQTPALCMAHERHLLSLWTAGTDPVVDRQRKMRNAPSVPIRVTLSTSRAISDRSTPRECSTAQPTLS